MQNLERDRFQPDVLTPMGVVVIELPPNTKYSEIFQDAISFAGEEAIRLGHSRVATDHLLIGAFRSGSPLLGIYFSGAHEERAQLLRNEVESNIGYGSSRQYDGIPLTESSYKALEAAIEEMKRYGDPELMDDHMVLGIAKVGNNSGDLIMESHGITFEDLRKSYHRTKVDPQVGKTFNAFVRNEHLNRVEWMQKLGDSGEALVIQALQEALDFNHAQLAPEHILLAATKHPYHALSARALFAFGVNHQEVRDDVTRLIGRGETPVTPIAAPSVAVSTRRVMNAALAHAYESSSPSVQDHHILQAATEETMTRSILEGCGVNVEDFRKYLRETLPE